MARSFADLMQKREALANSSARATVDVRMAFLKRVYKLVGLTAIAAGAGAIIPFYASPKYHMTLGAIGLLGYFIPVIVFPEEADLTDKILAELNEGHEAEVAAAKAEREAAAAEAGETPGASSAGPVPEER